MITNPPPGILDQGVIFSCASAVDYDGCEVHGLIITARCDITNDKADVYNYLPVVRFEDWLWRDGARIICGRTERSAKEDMERALNNAGFSPSILSTQSPSHIYGVLFANATGKVKDQSKPFKNAAARMTVAEACSKAKYGRAETAKLFAQETSGTKRLAKELCQNAVAEAYYLKAVRPGQDCLGYVVLLREIQHVPRALAMAILKGLDNEGYEELGEEQPRVLGRLNIPKDDLALPVGMIPSPFIEHLLQRWALLFSRIGVEDISDAHICKLQIHISEIKDI